MAKPKYNTRLHRALRKLGAVDVAQGQAYCAEPVCLEEQDGRGRWIPPGSDWAVCHAPDGLTYIGLGHKRCNDTEAAVRNQAARRQPPKRLAL